MVSITRAVHITKALHEWSSTVILIVSLTFSLLLFIICVSFLWRSRQLHIRGKPVIAHVAAIAGVDLAGSAWSYFAPCIYYRSFAILGDPPWCTLFFGIRWWLMILSAMFTVALAFGILSALLNWQGCVGKVRYSGFVVIPLSIVYAAPFFYYNVVVQAKFTPMILCVLHDDLDTIVAIETMSLLISVVFVHAFALWRTRNTLPGSVVRRSIRIASRYLIAFWLSFALFALACFQHVFDSNFSWDAESWWQWYVFIAWRLLMLNSVFNFVALYLHVRDVINNRVARGARSSVGLNANAEVVEVDAVDHISWARHCEVGMLAIEAENRQAWIDLGLEPDDSDDSFSTPALPRSLSAATLRMFLTSAMPSSTRVDWYSERR